MASKLVAMTFEGENDASALLGDLRKVAHVGQLHLTDTAVVRKDPDGTLHIDNEMGTGAEVGVVVGSIFGPMLMLFAPVAGIAAGAAIGGYIGSKVDAGIDGKFVKDVGNSLKPGGSALFVLASSGEPDAVLAVMRNYHGEVFQSTLEPEAEQALRDALKGQQ